MNSPKNNSIKKDTTVVDSKKATNKSKKESNTKSKASLNKAKEAERSSFINTTLWVLCIALVIFTAGANEYFGYLDKPIRVVGVLIGLVIAFGLFYLTNQGKKFVSFIRGSIFEFRRIFWPTKQEALQTTLVVIGISILVALFFWGFDAIVSLVVRIITTLHF